MIAIRDKISLIEKAINFPASLLPHRNDRWENLPMVRYSDLAGAVSSIAEKGKKAVIVTGFYIPGGDPPATETDGPPGALALAKGLKDLGMEVSLLSDEYSLSALKAGLKVLSVSEKEIPIICFPMEHSDQDHPSRNTNEANESPLSVRFVQDFFDGSSGKDLTHLIYIERVGPNHTLESFTAQDHGSNPPIKEFEEILPPPMRNRCFNSRVEDITRFTAKTHFLLEIAQRLPHPLGSIGVGDRGNEMGSGNIPWEIFQQNSSTNREAVFCCRSKTDYLISCGISNWGAYALLAGAALAMERLEVLEQVTPEREETILNYLVQYGPAIDGVTRRQEVSVDGIKFADYVKVIERIKEIALK